MAQYIDNDKEVLRVMNKKLKHDLLETRAHANHATKRAEIAMNLAGVMVIITALLTLTLIFT